MLKPLFILTLLFTCFFSSSFAQIGGNSVYQFLDLQASARGAAMGGSLLPGKSADVSLAQQNPTLIDSTIDGHFSLNYAPYFDDITLGNVAYAYRLKRKYTLASGIQFMRYGNFNGYDASGYPTGSFSAGEYAIYQSLSVPVNKTFLVGGNLKFIISDFHPFTSLGVAADVGVWYKNPEKLFTAGMIIKNAGIQITTYDGNARGNLPFEVQAGLTKKLSRAPILFSFTLQHLEKWDLSRPDVPNAVADQLGITFDTHTYNDFARNSLRHVILGAELLPDKPINIILGYNVLRGTDYKFNELNTLTDGFSFGFGLKIGAFQLTYGRAIYHPPFSINYFSITTNIHGLYSRAK